MDCSGLPTTCMACVYKAKLSLIDVLQPVCTLCVAITFHAVKLICCCNARCIVSIAVFVSDRVSFIRQ